MIYGRSPGHFRAFPYWLTCLRLRIDGQEKLTLINADKPWRWKEDIAASVDLFNRWFLEFAPATYQQERFQAAAAAQDALLKANDLVWLAPETLQQYPRILPMLRMSTAPPLARDRLIGLAGVPDSLVDVMEQGHLPSRMPQAQLREHLDGIIRVVVALIDDDIFPWVRRGQAPTDVERTRAATVIADRRCYAATNPIIRNAHERRQLILIGDFLDARGYRRQAHPSGYPLTDMEPGTYTFRLTIAAGGIRKVNIPIDVVVQPKHPQIGQLPFLIEAKSAGDFANVNKRRKEEASKLNDLRAAYGPHVRLLLFLCGYFGSPYLGYEAAEGLDWVWEHRIDDLAELEFD